MKALFYSVLVVAVLGLTIWGCTDYAQVNHETLHITGKESVDTGDGHEYRVYAAEDTYKISDSMLIGRFDSSRLYGSLKPGTYECETIGWRVPFFSMFRNIKSCEAT